MNDGSFELYHRQSRAETKMHSALGGKSCVAFERKLAETRALRREEWGGLVRGRIADYLIAQTELGKYPEEGFDQVFSKSDILPAFVRRWLAFLDRAERENDYLFVAWRAYRGIR